MIKKSLGLFSLVFFLVMALWDAPAISAFLELDVNSFFFGQRGAGVQIQGIHGTTDFGHPTGTPSYPLVVDMYGAGSASQTVTVNNVTYEVGAQLNHGIEVELSNDDMEADLDLSAHVSVTGILPSAYTVEITNNVWESRSYADAWGKTTFAVNGDPGETVRVHIYAEADSARNSPDFETEVALDGTYPNSFGIWHNGSEIWNGGRITYPHGMLLDDYVIDAVVGDTITIEASVCAMLWGSKMDDDFTGNYAFVNFNAHVTLEPDSSIVPGDIDADNDLDGSDLSWFCGVFSMGNPDADLNNDGIVDSGDVITFVDQFGKL